MNSYVDIDRYTFFEDSIITSASVLYCRKSVLKEKEKIRFVKGKTYQGYLTRSGKKRIKTKLTTWLTAMKLFNKGNKGSGHRRKHVPIFVTLTLSGKQIEDDRYIKRRLLEPFLKQMRYNGLYKHHFWRAERQKNDNIHFHLVFDQFIPMKEIQKRWNSVQLKNGYLDSFKIVYGHENAPSTHVEGIEEMNRATNYVLKYIQKEKDEMPIDGKVYAFSKELLQLNNYTVIDKFSSDNTMNEFLENESYNFFGDTFYGIDRIAKSDYYLRLPVDIYKDYVSFYLSVYANLYPSIKASEIMKSYLKLIELNKIERNKIKRKEDNEIIKK